MKVFVKGNVDLKKAFKKVLNEVTDDLFNEVRQLTPVDTGRAQSGWQIMRGGDTNIISNAVPYIEPLDKGHSDQAPEGMTKPAVQRIVQNAKSGKYKIKKRGLFK
tara:strand:+ start:1486 stop:1800 length:315 start_codon:yes stop_codon:yes gene_type:complete